MKHGKQKFNFAKFENLAKVKQIIIPYLIKTIFTTRR